LPHPSGIPLRIFLAPIGFNPIARAAARVHDAPVFKKNKRRMFPMKKNYHLMLTMTALAVLTFLTPLYASELDNRIEGAAKESYVFKTYFADDMVKASSKDGVVTLSGTVSQQTHKVLAQETVAGLPGVTRVDNRLELKAGYPDEKSNEWLALKIKAALLFHRNVSVMNTEVYVEEGIVTLRGEAANQAQKELTAEYANVEGVREVRNEMTISQNPETVNLSPGEKIDDASITAQIKTTLLNHRGTSALKTSVSTQDGNVILSGTASNAAEKSLVTKLVSDIHGVNNVTNNMTQG